MSVYYLESFDIETHSPSCANPRCDRQGNDDGIGVATKNVIPSSYCCHLCQQSRELNELTESNDTAIVHSSLCDMRDRRIRIETAKLLSKRVSDT